MWCPCESACQHDGVRRRVRLPLHLVRESHRRGGPRRLRLDGRRPPLSPSGAFSTSLEFLPLPASGLSTVVSHPLSVLPCNCVGLEPHIEKNSPPTHLPVSNGHRHREVRLPFLLRRQRSESHEPNTRNAVTARKIFPVVNQQGFLSTTDVLQKSCDCVPPFIQSIEWSPVWTPMIPIHVIRQQRQETRPIPRSKSLKHVFYDLNVRIAHEHVPSLGVTIAGSREVGPSTLTRTPAHSRTMKRVSTTSPRACPSASHDRGRYQETHENYRGQSRWWRRRSLLVLELTIPLGVFPRRAGKPLGVHIQRPSSLVSAFTRRYRNSCPS